MNPVSNWNMLFLKIYLPQSSPDEDIYTIPFLETVAGLALSMFWGSKISLQLIIIGRRSPLANVSVRLSSCLFKRGYRDFESQVPLRQEDIHIYQNRVEVFYPEWIYRAVQYQPYVVGFFHLECFSPKGRKDSICPVVCGNIKSPEHLTSCKKLWQLPYFIFDWWSVIVISVTGDGLWIEP